MNNDIETLATALYVKIDDMLKGWPDLALPRPVGGTAPTLGDAELLTMAVMSALLGFTSERRWLRYVNKYLAGMFPRRIGQSGYNKRLRWRSRHRRPPTSRSRTRRCNLRLAVACDKPFALDANSARETVRLAERLQIPPSIKIAAGIRTSLRCASSLPRDRWER